jgi:hypothetical protein
MACRRIEGYARGLVHCARSDAWPVGAPSPRTSWEQRSRGGVGLIVLHDGPPRAVRKSPVHHNLYPISTKRLEGEPLRVVSHKVDMRGRALRCRLDKRDTYYLSGEMMMGASWSGSRTSTSTGRLTSMGRSSGYTMLGRRSLP